jgi:large subunit ribosomal protein L19
MSKLNIQQTITNVEKEFLKDNLPVLRIGDNVRLGIKIIEGNKERTQFYEGTIIAKKIVQLIQQLQSVKRYKELV